MDWFDRARRELDQVKAEQGVAAAGPFHGPCTLVRGAVPAFSVPRKFGIRAAAAFASGEPIAGQRAPCAGIAFFGPHFPPAALAFTD